jgi:hypothetical protein
VGKPASKQTVRLRPMCGRLSVGKGYRAFGRAGRCGHVFGLLVRRAWPLAIMPSARTGLLRLRESLPLPRGWRAVHSISLGPRDGACRTKAHSEKHNAARMDDPHPRRDGQISRNQCPLSMLISRLASRIDDLEWQGWVFAAEKQGRDYVYRVERRPAREQIALSL